jgi:hypothetical protein
LHFSVKSFISSIRLILLGDLFLLAAGTTRSSKHAFSVRHITDCCFYLFAINVRILVTSYVGMFQILHEAVAPVNNLWDITFILSFNLTLFYQKELIVQEFEQKIKCVSS